MKYHRRFIFIYSVGVIIGLALILSCAKKEDPGPLHDVEARLYSIQAALSDPGDNAELYGHIYSSPKGGGGFVQHDHFQHTEDSHFEIGLSETRILPETPVTKKLWQEVGENLGLVVTISLVEDDNDLLDADDVFTDGVFQISYNEIKQGILADSGFYEKKDMAVFSGTEAITITFRFRIIK